LPRTSLSSGGNLAAIGRAHALPRKRHDMDRLWYFIGGTDGQFRITRTRAVIGQPLPDAPRLLVTQHAAAPLSAAFSFRGVTSNERYVTKDERATLIAKQTPLGRAEAVTGALIPIKKSSAWWALAQDERRAIIEERSQHIAVGLRALPAVARRLHHCRDLGSAEPFDFLTWFDFAPADSGIFDELLGALRSTPEWEYVEREVEIRVEREN